MAAIKNAERPERPVYCSWCGKEILPSEAYERSYTKRHTEVWMHRKCLRRKEREQKRDNRDQKAVQP